MDQQDVGGIQTALGVLMTGKDGQRKLGDTSEQSNVGNQKTSPGPAGLAGNPFMTRTTMQMLQQ